MSDSTVSLPDQSFSDQALRVIFMGTPDFAVPALEAIARAGHNIVAVYSQPPRPKGRGHKVQYSPVHGRALSMNIPVFTPASLKAQDVQDEFANLNADVAVVAAYGLLLPEAVLKAPRFGCLNIHASLLPRWRGASPIQHAIWKGDDKSGVTIMQMDKGLDTGDMIAKSALPLYPETTTQHLHNLLSREGGDLIVKVLAELAKTGTIKAEAQNNEEATYAPLLKKSDGAVEWGHSAQEIDRQVRALNPWPGVWSTIGERRIKILEVAPVDSAGDFSSHNPGDILDKDGHILCGGESVLKLLIIQPEGKKPMDFTAALNGGYLQVKNQKEKG